jgi:flagellar hook assembly protein FlgD
MLYTTLLLFTALLALSGFKTTIPFTTSAQGVASIRIVDQTGKVVLKDNENATYAGQHFFYFSGKNLPSGTYYYTIEFPQGVVIANKTMLVVK